MFAGNQHDRNGLYLNQITSLISQNIDNRMRNGNIGCIAKCLHGNTHTLPSYAPLTRRLSLFVSGFSMMRSAEQSAGIVHIVA